MRPVGQGRACLIMMTGAFPGETYLLEPGVALTIGRGAGNEIRLPYGDVSRVHAKASCAASGKVDIVDLGSTNGTFFNGRRKQFRVLREGDKIQFGERTVFRFAFHDEVDEEFQEKLFGAPFLDRVTNTLRRERLTEALAHAHAQSLASGADLSVVAMAIDGFELIEQLLGIAVRDYFLRELSWVIRKAVAGEATLYRTGPDGFATLVPGLAPEAALEIADRIRTAVASARLTHEGDRMMFSLALGVSSLVRDRRTDPQQMLALAEARCRRAMADGGDRVEAASAE